MQLPSAFLDHLQYLSAAEKQALSEAHQQPVPISVRFNPFKICTPKFSIKEPVIWCNHAVYLPERPQFIFDPLIHAGAYYVQEASSMFLHEIIRQLFGTSTDKIVLDLCAAPGGKSTLLSSFFKDGLVLSNEVIKSRAAILEENIVKWGLGNVVVSNADPAQINSLKGMFDAIVVDAPCSGSGLFRKDTQALQEWSIHNVYLCAERQQRILAQVVPALKKDGFLIYSTCSFSYEEDEAILDWITKEFNLSSIKINIQAFKGVKEYITQEKNYGYHFFPHLIQGEGFYITVLQKNAEEELMCDKKLLQKISLQENNLLQNHFSFNETINFFKIGNLIHAFPEKYLEALSILAKHLHIKYAGTALGEIKGKSFIPHHASALNPFIQPQMNRIELNEEEAIAYLKKQLVAIDAPNGWHLITYQQLGLGYIKHMGNRYNNYYPVEWRILKD